MSSAWEHHRAQPREEVHDLMGPSKNSFAASLTGEGEKMGTSQGDGTGKRHREAIADIKEED